jgi:transitional endoplasmic reticulum ATPase
MPPQPPTKLRVAEALQDDAYRGIARIDFEIMKQLGIRRGDIIAIKGSRETVAIADKAYPADVGEGIIRVDGIIRKNARTSVGENVTVSKANVKEAKKVTIAPAQKGIRVQGDLKPGLLGRAVIKGDILVLGGLQRRRDMMGDEMGMDDIFGNLNDLFGGGFNNLGGMQQIRFIVANSNPNSPCVITENTEVVLSNKPVEISDETIPEVTYEDIGGLTDEVKKIREMVEVPLKHPEVFERLGVEPPKGVLLHGPPGTGKTLLAKAVANESDANFILLNGPEVMSKFYGESEKKIRDIFEEAEKNAPSIIFIDEIDSIAPQREDVGGEVERRVVSQLLTMMDGLQSRGKVVVIAATNRPNSIDPALRRPGRFDRELELRAPDKKGRLQVLKIHSRGMPLTKDVNLDHLASVTHGFVGADISALTKEAAMVVLRRLLPKLNLKEDEEIPEEVLKDLRVTKADFDESLKVVRPSAMREVLVETPNISWSDVGGLDKIQQELIEAVEWPLKYPGAFKRMGIKPPRGILLYGPPGTGKTLLAKAVAKESEANFIQVKGPSLLSMWVGKSEEGVRKIFDRARQVSPCIVFFDEIDSLAGKRGMESGTKVTERVLNQLLAEMDGIEDLSNVIVIAATNRPDMLDSALLRPGRFDRILLVGSPEREGREQIMKIHTKEVPLAKNVNLNKLIDQTEGYTGADVESFVREAVMLALRENIASKEVSLKHFEEALKKVSPSVTKADMDRYRKIETDYLRSAKAALENQSAYLG